MSRLLLLCVWVSLSCARSAPSTDVVPPREPLPVVAVMAQSQPGTSRGGPAVYTGGARVPWASPCLPTQRPTPGQEGESEAPLIRDAEELRQILGCPEELPLGIDLAAQTVVRIDGAAELMTVRAFREEGGAVVEAVTTLRGAPVVSPVGTVLAVLPRLDGPVKLRRLTVHAPKPPQGFPRDGRRRGEPPPPPPAAPGTGWAEYDQVMAELDEARRELEHQNRQVVSRYGSNDVPQALEVLKPLRERNRALEKRRNALLHGDPPVDVDPAPVFLRAGIRFDADQAILDYPAVDALITRRLAPQMAERVRLILRLQLNELPNTNSRGFPAASRAVAGTLVRFGLDR